MNIIYLHSHDTGRYIQPYGFNVPTPRLQGFAEEGVLFRNAFCNNPTCSPSRACLLSGQHAHVNGMLGLTHRGAKLREPEHVLPHYLHGHGYETVLAGLQHVTEGPVSGIGYETDLTHGRSGSDDAANVESARKYLRDYDGKRPFFLDCGFFTTHRTSKKGDAVQWHNAGQSPVGDPRYVRGPACLPDVPEVRRDFADYRVAAGRLDEMMGSVIAAVDEAGLRDSTLIVVTTDHGIAFPKMKCHLTDAGTGVMLMMRGPTGAAFSGGRVLDTMVQHIDLFPTLCKAAGLPSPDWVQGRSLLPLLRDEVEYVHEHIFAEVNNHAAWEPKRSVRSERYRLIQRFDGRNTPVLPNCDDSPSKAAWLAAGGRDEFVPTEALYDLWFDPTEADNRIDDPTLAGVRDDLRGRLEVWMRETDDPVLRDPAAIREGFKLNDPDAVSPRGEIEEF